MELHSKWISISLTELEQQEEMKTKNYKNVKSETCQLDK